MMKRMMGLAIVAAALAATGCSSPVESARAPEDGVRTTAADSGTARNGGNLMGGN